MGARVRDESGVTIIEVLVATIVLVMGALATFGSLSLATVNSQRAKATQVALDRAQQEMELLRSLPNDDLAMTASPPHSNDSLSPDYRVSNGTYALTRSPVGSYANMVVNGGSLYGGGTISGGTVDPGPQSFSSGDVTGEIYRYVVWRDDTSCPATTCPGTQDYKQIVVAVKLDTPGDQSGERGYVEVQSAFIDPSDSAADDPVAGSSGVVTAQQFFLSDTPCSSTGTTVRQDITGDHPLHNTLGTCASGAQTGSTAGAPDALLTGAPPDPAPDDPSNPPLYDYSNDYVLQPTPDTSKGIQLRRDDSSGCHYVPTGKSAPQWQVHRWVTDPMASAFVMTGNVTLDFFTRSLSDSLYHGTLCAYLFTRHQPTPTTATDTMLTNKTGGAAYWTETPSGSGYWWSAKDSTTDGWSEVRLAMSFNGPVTIPVGDQLGVALSVDGKTEGDAIPILYDHPDHRTRIEVDTSTPVNGG